MNTLQRLKANLYLIWALDVLFLIALISAARIHNGQMKTIGKDAVPGIIGAQHIKSALADMDSNAVNILLSKAGLADAAKGYEAHRREAAKAIVEAAENISFDEAERAPILTLQTEMGAYMELIQRARDLHERGDGHSLETYRQAASLMDQILLPAADAIDRANYQELDRLYKSDTVAALASRWFVFLAGAGLIGVLVWVQAFLSNRTRRTFNLALMAATFLAGLFLMSAGKNLSASSRQLRIAKEDAFTSIHALWQARAAAYAADADQSRYLLDIQNSAAIQRTFAAKADSLWKANRGYLADELKNITFEGEREAAQETLQRFRDYLATDKEIVRLLGTRNREGAITLCLGLKPGQSNYAFERFDAALGRTLDINQKAFEQAVSRGFEVLSNAEAKAYAMVALIAAVAFAGLHIRIREYQ